MSHTGQWPPYLPKSFPDWSPAVLVGNRLSWRSGQEGRVTLTWQQLRDCIEAHNLVVFTDDLTGFPYLEGVREDRFAHIIPGKEHLKIRLRAGRKSRWIVPYRQWSSELTGLDFLSMIELVFQHCEMVSATPGSLGKNLMLGTWSKYQSHRKKHSRPSKSARLSLKHNMTGGRIQLFDGPANVRVDQCNALVSHFQQHPTGTACRYSYHPEERQPRPLATWFVECVVVIPHELPLGPFPIRTDTGPVWPTSPGTYTCWLWKEQAEDAERAGCKVYGTLRGGWAWQRFTRDNRRWARKMIDLRNRAPNESVRATIKRVAAAGISFHGIGDQSHKAVSVDEARPGDKPCFDSMGALEFLLRTTEDSINPTMVHWYAYTWMQVARTAYKMALPAKLKGALVAIKTDCLILSRRVRLPLSRLGEGFTFKTEILASGP